MPGVGQEPANWPKPAAEGACAAPGGRPRRQQAQKGGDTQPSNTARASAGWPSRGRLPLCAIATLCTGRQKRPREQLQVGLVALCTAAETPEVKNRLRDETNQAMARGVFGVPTWVVDEQIGDVLLRGTHADVGACLARQRLYRD